MTIKSKEHVLVAGASGLVGRAAVEHFVREGFRVTALSRGTPFDTYGAGFRSVDLANRVACEHALMDIDDCTRVVFAALHEERDLVAGWLTDAHVHRNGDMLRNLVDVVANRSSRLHHVTIIQGPKAYGAHVRRIRPDARELRDDMRDVPNFYWVQQDYLADKSRGAAWKWTIFRPSLVVGEAVGAAMNLVAALGAYAALLKAAGQPFHYPSAYVSAFQPSDTDLVARAIRWAGESDSAANRVFNITNGEVFALKDLWPQLADAFGMKVGEDRPCEFAKTMPGRAADWDEIRRKYRLRAPGLEDYIGRSWQFLDFVFNLRPAAIPSLISTIAIHQAGFHHTLYTDEMFAKWIKRYQDDGLLPPRSGLPGACHVTD